MPRVKRGVTSHHKHKRVLALTKGQRASRHSLIKRAREALLHSQQYAYAHRRERKSDMRRLWIMRINAAARLQGLPYAHFMEGLRKGRVDINRKVLADLAVRDPAAFNSLVTVAKQNVQAE